MLIYVTNLHENKKEEKNALKHKQAAILRLEDSSFSRFLSLSE